MCREYLWYSLYTVVRELNKTSSQSVEINVLYCLILLSTHDILHAQTCSWPFCFKCIIPYTFKYIIDKRNGLHKQETIINSTDYIIILLQWLSSIAINLCVVGLMWFYFTQAAIFRRQQSAPAPYHSRNSIIV